MLKQLFLLDEWNSSNSSKILQELGVEIHALTEWHEDAITKLLNLGWKEWARLHVIHSRSVSDDQTDFYDTLNQEYQYIQCVQKAARMHGLSVNLILNSQDWLFNQYLSIFIRKQMYRVFSTIESWWNEEMLREILVASLNENKI